MNLHHLLEYRRRDRQGNEQDEEVVLWTVCIQQRVGQFHNRHGAIGGLSKEFHEDIPDVFIDHA